MNKNYIDQLIELIKSDIKTKYKNAWLGILWIIFEPFFIMIILYLVFNRFIRFEMQNYPLYLLSGITIWRIFVNTTVSGLTSLYRNRELLLKMNINRHLIPMSCAFTGIIIGFFELIVYICFYVFLTHSFDFIILLSIPFLIVYIFFIMGIIYIVSIIYVFIKDMKPAWEIFIQALFFLCPIFYPFSIVPYKYIFIYLTNPIAVFIIGFQNILFYNRFPEITIIINSFFFAIILYLLGYIVFQLSIHKAVKSL